MLYKDYDKVSKGNLLTKRAGWQINSRLIMELDSEGPFFSAYPKDITGDTVQSEAAVVSFAVTIPNNAGKALGALGMEQIAAMTIAELGEFLTEQKRKLER